MLKRKRTESANQWAADRDRRSYSERAIDAYLATVPGSEKAAERMLYIKRAYEEDDNA